MPRAENAVSKLLADAQAQLARLVDAACAAGRESALAEVRALVSGTALGRRGPGRPRSSTTTKPAKRAARGRKRRNPWKHMTAEQRQERIRKMLAGRGLKPKAERG